MLKEGNERFLSGHHLTRDLRRQLSATAVGQHPLAVVLSCIDSRTPVELVLNLGLGDVFSVRVAGNVISPKVLGSMEYGCAVAGAKVALVMGHTRCGAVGAAVSLSGSATSIEEVTGCQHLDAILHDIQAHFDPATLGNVKLLSDSDRQTLVDDVALANVKHVVADIMVQSRTLAKLVEERQIAIVGSMYDVKSGHIHFIKEATVGLSAEELDSVLTSFTDAKQ